VQTQEEFHDQFYFTSTINCFIGPANFVLLEMISFEKIFKTVTYKLAIQCK